MVKLNIIAKAALDTATNFDYISDADRKELIKAGFICLMSSSRANRILDVARSAMSQEDNLSEFDFVRILDRKRDDFTFWGREVK
jgi:hypothetical protein